MKLAVKTAVVGAVLASTAVLAAPGTASADPKDGYIGGRVYLFDGHDLTGDSVGLIPANYPFIGWEWNDRASSVWNLSNMPVCVYTDADDRGYHFSIKAGQQQELLFLYDNAVSSISISGCGG